MKGACENVKEFCDSSNATTISIAREAVTLFRKSLLRDSTLSYTRLDGNLDHWLVVLQDCCLVSLG